MHTVFSHYIVVIESVGKNACCVEYILYVVLVLVHINHKRFINESVNEKHSLAMDQETLLC